MTRHPLQRALAGDRGSISTETAVLAPALFLLLGLMIAFGRIVDAEGAVDSAARAAARAASLERDAGNAQTLGQEAAARSLEGEGVTCQTNTVTVDMAGFAAQVGEHATVTAAISCTANLSDIGIPGLPGAKTCRSTQRAVSNVSFVSRL